MYSMLFPVIIFAIILCIADYDVCTVVPYFKRTEVGFGIVEHMLLSERESKRAFGEAMNSFVRNHLKFLDRIRIRDPLVVPLGLEGKLNPTKILNTLCRTLLPKRINALVLVTFDSDDESKSEEANAIQYLFQLLSFLRLPVITWRPQNTGQINSDLLVLQMSSTINHQAAAVVSILKRYKYDKISIVAVKCCGHDIFLTAIRQEIERNKIEALNTIILDSVDLANVRKEFKALEDDPTRIFVFFSPHRNATPIFEIAAELGFTGKDYLWICMQKVIGDMTEKGLVPKAFPIGMLGIDTEMTQTSLVRAAENAIRIYGYALDTLLKETNYSSNQFSPNVSCATEKPWELGQEFFRTMHRVVVPAGGHNKQKLEFLHDGTVKFAEFNITNLSQDPKSPSYSKWTKVGEWRSDSGLHLTDIVWPGNQAVPPRGRPEKYHFNIVTHHEKPYVIMKEQGSIAPHPSPYSVLRSFCATGPSGQCEPRSSICRRRPENWTIGAQDEWTNMCCTGLCIDLLLRLKSEMQFTYQLYHVEDGNWGGNVDGQWNGLIADLLDKKADFALTSLKVTKQREKVIAFSMIYLETGITIVVAKKDGAISPAAFLKPFDPTTWIILMIVCVQTVSIVIFMLEWLSPSGFNMASSLKAKQRFSFMRVYWLVFATFFGSNMSTTLPRSFSAKALTGVWGCCSLVFITVYTANLATFMITRDGSLSLSGIDDNRIRNPCSVNPTFRFGTIPNGSTSETLDHGYNDIYQHMKKYNKKTVEDGIACVKNETLDAFLYDATVLEYQMGSDPDCKIKTTGTWFATTGYAIAFHKSFKLIGLFNERLEEYQRIGYLKQLQSFWLSGACTLKRQENSSHHQLGIKNFFSAFFFLGAGVGIGIGCLMIEWMYFHCLRLGFCKWVYNCKMCRFLSSNLTRAIAASAVKHKHIGSNRRIDLDLVLIADLNKNATDLQAARAEVEKLEKIRDRLQRRKPTLTECTWGKPLIKKEENGRFPGPEVSHTPETVETLRVVEFETVL